MTGICYYPTPMPTQTAIGTPGDDSGGVQTIDYTLNTEFTGGKCQWCSLREHGKSLILCIVNLDGATFCKLVPESERSLCGE